MLESISNIACAVQRLVLCGLPGTWHMHFGVVCTNECSFRVWIKVNMNIEYAMSKILCTFHTHNKTQLQSNRTFSYPHQTLTKCLSIILLELIHNRLGFSNTQRCIFTSPITVTMWTIHLKGENWRYNPHQLSVCQQTRIPVRNCFPSPGHVIICIQLNTHRTNLGCVLLVTLFYNSVV